MNRHILIAFVLTWSVASQAATKIENWTMDNGTRVFYVHAPQLPMVDISVAFDAGSARDGDSHGLALMTNGMLAEGAGDMDADTIADRFEGVGAHFGNSARRDMSVLNLRSLTEPALLKTAVDTFSAVLNAPKFPQDAFDRERSRALVGLVQQKQDPSDIANEAFFKAVYGNHPYAHQPDGEEDTLKALTRDQLVSFYKEYFVGRNAWVVVVGALDRAATETLVRQVVGDLPAGLPAIKLPGLNSTESAIEKIIDFPSSQSHVMVGQPGIRRDDPDYFPLYVGNHVLGGGGLVSLLADEIREKRGYAYSTYSQFSPLRVEGPFVIGLETRNDQVQDAIKVMREVVQNFVSNGPTAKELDDAKRNLTGGFALKVASNKSIADQLANMAFYGLPLDYLDTYIDHINAVTVAQVRDAFQRRVQPARMVTVVVGATAENGAKRSP